MTNTDIRTKAHPPDTEIADFLAGSLPDTDRLHIEEHIASCDQCLAKTVSAQEAVVWFRNTGNQKKKRKDIMKKINLYLALAVITFALSFIIPRYFIQLLVATLILGIKWVTDSRSARMLVMIHEAWKTDGPGGASRILETLENKTKKRF